MGCRKPTLAVPIQHEVFSMLAPFYPAQNASVLFRQLDSRITPTGRIYSLRVLYFFTFAIFEMFDDLLGGSLAPVAIIRLEILLAPLILPVIRRTYTEIIRRVHKPLFAVILVVHRRQRLEQLDVSAAVDIWIIVVECCRIVDGSDALAVTNHVAPINLFFRNVQGNISDTCSPTYQFISYIRILNADEARGGKFYSLLRNPHLSSRELLNLQLIILSSSSLYQNWHVLLHWSPCS